MSKTWALAACNAHESTPHVERLQQARDVLQTLRALSFGGRLQGAGAPDKLSTLMAYCPSLRTLAHLLKRPLFADGARVFLREISLPQDLQPWLAAALGVTWPQPAPTAQPDATAPRGAPQLASAPCGNAMPRGADVYWRRVKPEWFEASDTGLEVLISRYGSFAKVLDMEYSGLPGPLRLAALRAYDRALAVGLDAEPLRGLDTFLNCSVLPAHLHEDPEVPLALVKLCMRVGLNPWADDLGQKSRWTDLHCFRQAWALAERMRDGLASPLQAVTQPAVGAQVSAAVADGALEMSQLSQWLSQGEGVVLAEVLPAMAQARQAGTLQRLDGASLNAQERQALAAALRALPHPGCAAVVAALAVDGVDSELGSAWLEEGYGSREVAAWRSIVHRVRTLGPEALGYALADLLKSAPILASLPLRLHLACTPLSDSVAVQAAFERRESLSEEAALRILAARAATDAEQQQALLMWLGGAQAPSAQVVGAVIERDGLQATLPPVHAQLHEAVQRCWSHGCSEKMSGALAATLTRLAAVVPPAVLVRAALQALYEQDMAQALPLACADTAAKVARRPDGRADSVHVVGVRVPVSRNLQQDRRAVPRKVEADLVLTGTTETNLWRLATMVRAGKSVLLEGPTSAGKTAAVRYLAYRTNNPLRRITLSFRTEVADLIGRWVAGVERYKVADLAALSAKQVAALAREYGADDTAERDTQQQQILKKQRLPRWVDGLVVQAVRRGEWLILDEINLAPHDVIERLNSLFDDDGNITLESGESVSAHPNFRAFATMNPGNYVGRAQLSDALRSRWARVFCHGLTRADVTQILKARFGEAVPAEEMKKLVVAHSLLSEAADKGTVARNLGGISFSLRNLRNVCERFVAYRGRGLSDAALMRRETEEVYRDGLPPTDVQAVNDVLAAAMPYDGPGFHENLQLTVDADSITLGDVTLPCIGPRAPKPRAQLILTQRTLQLLYRLAKIIDRGENALLIGGKASGKTSLVAMLAELLGQPYQRQMIGPATDTMQLVGAYTTQGWQDGVILQGGRPENTPAITLLDEINFGDSATLERLNGAFEKDDRTVVITEGDGSVVHLHAQSHVMGAMNPPGEKYGGRKRLSKALQNRMTAVYVPELTEREELQHIARGMAARRIADPAVAQVVADALLEAHQWVAHGYENGTLGRGLLGTDKPVLSIRSLLRALDVTVELMRDMSVGQAFLHAVQVGYASEATEADNAAILQMARLLAA